MLRPSRTLSPRGVLAAACAVFGGLGTAWFGIPPGAVDPDQTAAASSTVEPQGPGRGMGRGMGMGMRGGAAPADHPFTEAKTCALCHSAAETASALWSATGEDVSPHGMWQASMMANSFRDPYWRAQVSKEVAGAPDQQGAIEGLCVTCHAPAAHHAAKLAGGELPGIAAALADPVGPDGVTCTVCHQIEPEQLGDPESFSGNITIAGEKRIYGPFEDPAFQPMLMHTGYQATHGAHVRDAAHCGACHTLYTHHAPGAEAFPEQAPYLEWLNSEFSDEAGASETSRTCQECHMPDQGPMRIARNPAGLDFNIQVRDPYRAHTFVGGNAFMLGLMRDNAEELGVLAPEAAMNRAIRATRHQLATDTARLDITGAEVVDGKLSFAVEVTNETGHKLPTGYPARRAWLRVVVRAGRQALFDSGGFDDAGELVGVADPSRIPHYDVITDASQVQVYETIAADAEGEPTTFLTRMASVLKDNRLLPRGYRAEGPYSKDTAPQGVDGDPDFGAGRDVVKYRIDLPEGAGENLVVVAWLLYQPIPPRWVEALRSTDTEEAERFVRMYDAASKRPETLGVTVEILR